MHPAENTQKKPGRRRRLLWISSLLLGSILTLLLTFPLWINLAPLRAFIVERVNAALAETFAGRLELTRFARLRLDGVDNAELRVFDPEGRQVIAAYGVSARIAWPRLVWALLTDAEAPLEIRLPRVSLEHADIALFDPGATSPSLARAFAARTPSAAPSDQATRVSIEHIETRHFWVHGQWGSLPSLDAELADVLAAFTSDEQAISVRLDTARLQARAPLGPVDSQGNLAGRLQIGNAAQALDVEVAFDGVLAAIPGRARFRLQNEIVNASIEAEASPAALTRLVPELTPQAPLKASAWLAGPLTQLDFHADVLGLGGPLTLAGTVALRDTTNVELTLRARDFDAAVLRDGPSSRVSLDLTARATLNAGQVSGSYELQTEPSQVASYELPRSTVSGAFRHAAELGTLLDGSATLAEPGARTTLDFALRSGSSTLLDVRSRTQLLNPPRLTALVAGLHVSGNAESWACWDMTQNSLDARLDTQLAELSAAGVRSAQLRATATVSGKLEQPQIALVTRAERLEVGQRVFSLDALSLHGNLRAARLEVKLNEAGAREIALKSALALQPLPVFEDVSLSLKHESSALLARTRRVELGKDRVRVDQFEFDGAGHVEASATFGQKLEQLDLQTNALDIQRLANALGFELPLKRGLFSVTADYRASGGRPRGQVQGVARHLAFGRVVGGSLDLDVRLASNKLSGKIQGNLGEAGQGVLSLDDVQVLEPPFNSAKFSEFQGTLELEARLDLARLEPLLGADALPLGQTAGSVELMAELRRPSRSERWPRLRAHVRTQALALAGKRSGNTTIKTAAQARAADPWSITGVDFNGELDLDDAAGKLVLSVDAFDRSGKIVSARLDTQAPEWRLTELAAIYRSLLAAPVRAQLEVPPRTLQGLPRWLRPATLSGKVALAADLSGNLQDPSVRLHASAYGLATRDAKATPLDVQLDAAYARSGGELAANASTAGRTAVKLALGWDGELLRALQRAAGEPSALSADAVLDLERFPLESVPALQIRGMRGLLSGQLKLVNFGKDARVSGHLDARQLRVGGAKLAAISADVDTSERLKVDLKVNDPRASLKAAFTSALRWGDALVPEIDEPLEARVSSSNFRIATLAPLFEDSLGELDGLVTANMVLRQGGARSTLQGQVEVHSGVIQEMTLGQRFTNINAKAVLTPESIRLEHLSARGTTGKLSVTGSAKVDGLRLRSATAELDIKKSEKIPVTMKGVAIGDAWGRVAASFRPGDPQRPALLLVNVKQLHLQVPETETHNVQSLDPAPAILVGVPRSDGRFVALPLQPLEEAGEAQPGEPLVVRVTLGSDVWVERGNELKVRVTGQTRLEMDEQLSMGGRIRLSTGVIDVSGKPFQIESGVVTFDGADPANPTVVARARWDSPADYRVYAEYVGRVADGKLTLRTEPPLPQDKILSLLLFGSPDGSLGSGSGDATTTAVGAVGGTAARGLNRLLAGITDLDVDARVDTSTGSARPELVLQVTRRVSARVTRALGEPPPGQAPDRTFLTLDLRVGGRWSLSTMVGDRGASALDLIWRHLY